MRSEGELFKFEFRIMADVYFALVTHGKADQTASLCVPWFEQDMCAVILVGTPRLSTRSRRNVHQCEESTWAIATRTPYFMLPQAKRSRFEISLTPNLRLGHAARRI